MRKRKKKTWSDPVIEAANKKVDSFYPPRQTPKERELLEILRGILRGILIIRGNPDLHPIYTGDENTDTILAHREWAIQKIMHSTIRDLQENYEPPELIWDYSTDKDKPRLRITLDPSKQVFSDLAQKLQDPEWVSALSTCPECGNFLLSNSIWAKKGRKFCSTKCKEKHHGRKPKKKKENKRKVHYTQLIECPGNSEEITTTLTECIDANEKNIRGKFKYTCPICPYNIEGFRLQTFKDQIVKLTLQEESNSSQEEGGPKIKKGGDD